MLLVVCETSFTPSQPNHAFTISIVTLRAQQCRSSIRRRIPLYIGAHSNYPFAPSRNSLTDTCIQQAITAEPLPLNGSNPANPGSNGVGSFPVPSSQSQLTSSMSMPSPLPQQVQAQGPPGFSYVDVSQTHTQSMAQQQQSTQQQQQQRQLPSSLSDLVSTFEASKEKGLFGIGLLVSLWRLTSFLKSRATGSRTNKQGARCRV
jgi:hypothetical protein